MFLAASNSATRGPTPRTYMTGVSRPGTVWMLNGSCAGEQTRGSGGRRGGVALGVIEEAVEGQFVGVVVFPIAEIRYEILANLAGRVLAGVGVKTLPVAKRFECAKADREEDAAAFLDFPLAGLRYFCLDPFAVHAVRGEDQQQFVMHANGFVDLFMEFLAAAHVVRSKPAADAFGLQVCV